MDKKIRVGLLGIGGRARHFADLVRKYPLTELAGVCDNDPLAMARSVEEKNLQDIPQYTDYATMLKEAGLDLVFVCTPMKYHCEHVIMALDMDINCVGEVPVAATIEQSREMVKAVKRSKAKYFFAENMCYAKSMILIREMVKAGLLGNVHYAEGEYIHDLKKLSEFTPWRYDELFGVNGITYGTHSLGPILSWFDFDRIKKVSCVGSGNYFHKPDGTPFKMHNSVIMMGITEKDRLIKIRNDFADPRPSINEYILQGDKGAFESRRGIPETKDWIWIQDYVGTTEERYRNSHDSADTWMDLSIFENRYFPQKFKEWVWYAKTYGGHEGADAFMFVDIVDAVANGLDPFIDIHRGLDMTLPGLYSTISINNGGEWVEVPDSRKW